MGEEVVGARALYVPLADTLQAWEAAHPPPRRFLDALALVPTLVDGAERGALFKNAREPKCLQVPVHAWLAQRLVLAYVCHAPYVRQTRVPPPEMQPFRAAVEQVYAWMQRRDEPSGAPRWFAMYTESAVHDVQDTLYHLLGAPRSVEDVGHVVPAQVCQLPICPHQTLPQQLDVDRAVHALQRAASTALGVPEQRFLLAYLQRAATHDADACILLAHTFGYTDVARVAVHNPHVAYEWVVCSCVHTALPSTFWEELGTACAEHAQTHLAAQRHIHELLAHLCTPKSPANVRVAVQTHTLPRYLGLRAQHLAAVPDAATEELGIYVAQLVERDLLPIHASQRTWDVPQPEDALDALAVELRSMALAYSKYAFGAQLFHTLVRA